jgi:hypothetical protein
MPAGLLVLRLLELMTVSNMFSQVALFLHEYFTLHVNRPQYFLQRFEHKCIICKLTLEAKLLYFGSWSDWFVFILTIAGICLLLERDTFGINHNPPSYMVLLVEIVRNRRIVLNPEGVLPSSNSKIFSKSLFRENTNFNLKPKITVHIE